MFERKEEGTCLEERRPGAFALVGHSAAFDFWHIDREYGCLWKAG